MKIAFLGTRGVPARYGGFETCVEEIGKRLAARGHQVWVYRRSGYYKKKQKKYLGMQLISLPEVRFKVLETLFHTFIATLHALWRRFDVYFIFNVANSPLLIIPWLSKKKTVLHVDGLEWKREKWSVCGKKYFKYSEWLAAKFSCKFIADSIAIRDYYRKEYGIKLHYIPYGADIMNSQKPDLLEQFRISPGSYFLQITRFEPENNPLLSVKAVKKLRSTKKMVLVGGQQYNSSYSIQIRSEADKKIIFTGYIYDKAVLRELLCNCYAYIHGNEAGGTNPALLQAMASGCFVLARDVVFNRDVLGDTGIYFKKSVKDLKLKLTWTLENPRKVAEMSKKSKKIIREFYNWDSVVSDYEKLFYSLL